MDDRISQHKIFLPIDGHPRIVINSTKDFGNIIGSNNITRRTLAYPSYFGYKISVLSDISQKSLPVNNFASLLCKESIRGNCIITDCDVELSLNDLDILAKIATVIPSDKWMPEHLLEKYPINKDFREEISGKAPKLEVWNEIAKYYVEPTEQHMEFIMFGCVTD
jgi:hypothetical protein